MTNDQEWHEWRRGGVGGSDVAAIIGLSNYGSPWTVWADKVGLRKPSEASQRQRIGLRMETVLGQEFTDATGLYIAGEQTWRERVKHPTHRCTVDGFVFEVPGAEDWDLVNALGVVQMKTDGRRAWPDGVPANIRAQCVWEMGVTGLPHCWLVVMFSGFRVEVFEIPWDLEAIEDFRFMEEEVDRFWTQHVVTGIAPDVDASDATTNAIREIWPAEDPGSSVDIDPDLVVAWGDVKDQLRPLEAELKRITNALKEEMADAEVGLIGGIPAVTLRSQTRKTTCPACGHVDESDPFRVLRPAGRKAQQLQGRAA